LDLPSLTIPLYFGHDPVHASLGFVGGNHFYFPGEGLVGAPFNLVVGWSSPFERDAVEENAGELEALGFGKFEGLAFEESGTHAL